LLFIWHLTCAISPTGLLQRTLRLCGNVSKIPTLVDNTRTRTSTHDTRSTNSMNNLTPPILMATIRLSRFNKASDYFPHTNDKCLRTRVSYIAGSYDTHLSEEKVEIPHEGQKKHWYDIDDKRKKELEVCPQKGILHGTFLSLNVFSSSLFLSTDRRWSSRRSSASNRWLFCLQGTRGEQRRGDHLFYPSSFSCLSDISILENVASKLDQRRRSTHFRLPRKWSS